MKDEVGIGSLSQADIYCDILAATNNGTLNIIYDESLATMPRNIHKIYSDILKYKKQNNSNSARNNRRKKPSEASQQREKIKVFAASKGYQQMKIPANAMQRKFIIDLMDENKKLGVHVQKKNKVALQQGVKLTKLKHMNQKRQKEYAKLMAHKNQLKQERDQMYRDQRSLLTLLKQKDSKIADLVVVCQKELRSKSNKNASDEEQHLNELIE